jgi:signal transduction histidine kinase
MSPILMRTLGSPERPAARNASRWAFDIAVTVLATASALPYLVRNSGHHPHPSQVLVLFLVAAPLIVRRIWPVQVFAWLMVTAIGAALWDEHVVAGGPVLLGLFTVAAMKPRRVALTTALILELGMLAAVVGLAGGDWWTDAIFLSGMIAAAAGLGLYFATRRAYLDALHDRAERLERERGQLGALAAAAERDRIAREMHDIVAHHLTVMVALSDGAIAASATSPERAVEVMRRVSATGRRALTDTRRLLGVLRTGTGSHADGTDDPPQDLQPMPDLAELDVLIERVRAAGLATTLEVHGAAAEVPAGVQLTVYRLVQEALTNTLKHGGGDAHALVRLHYLPGELRINVDDDGVGGFSPTPPEGGSGLAGMRERVHAYGGQVEAGPRQPAGWGVAARLYLDDGDVR